MNENLHQRAQRLLAESLVEGIAAPDQAWLGQHLRECPACAHEAGVTQEALRALRGVPVAVPRDLVARTQLRVRLRAQQAGESSRANLLLWVITAASWLLGVFSAPLVWRGFAWFGGEFGVPRLALEMGFVLWWTVPALLAVAAVLYQRAAAQGFADEHSRSESKKPR
ncbi:MAG TPA: hypothetical protein VFB10_02985 [Candidatus Dormibacteraeota bacterium]|nr:hypothetical protein [Candidatus Dormibacteraeota bacterium]